MRDSRFLFAWFCCTIITIKIKITLDVTINNMAVIFCRNCRSENVFAQNGKEN